MKRVVVTGVGCVTPVGNDVDATWREMGVPATVLNSTQFLDRVSRPATDRHRLVIGPGSLILVDEASMLPTGHAAAIKPAQSLSDAWRPRKFTISSRDTD